MAKNQTFYVFKSKIHLECQNPNLAQNEDLNRQNILHSWWKNKRIDTLYIKSTTNKTFRQVITCSKKFTTRLFSSSCKFQHVERSSTPAHTQFVISFLFKDFSNFFAILKQHLRKRLKNIHQQSKNYLISLNQES